MSTITLPHAARNAVASTYAQNLGYALRSLLAALLELSQDPRDPVDHADHDRQADDRADDRAAGAAAGSIGSGRRRAEVDRGALNVSGGRGERGRAEQEHEGSAERSRPWKQGSRLHRGRLRGRVVPMIGVSAQSFSPDVRDSYDR